jgi:hypothetical protein
MSAFVTYHWCDCLRIRELTFPSQISKLGASQIGELDSAPVEIGSATLTPRQNLNGETAAAQ